MNAYKGWLKSRKGSAIIYTKFGYDHAVVDRQGFGINSAMGHSITYNDVPFENVESAIDYAEMVMGKG